MSLETRQKIKDIASIIGFVAAVVIGAWLINSLVFRSFSVSGPSMETTMYTNDRLIVNRLPITWDTVTGQKYMPSRGHVIVFKNPLYDESRQDEYIVKRVIGLPGDRVVVAAGAVFIFNKDHPDGFDPYADIKIPEIAVTGQVDETVQDDQLFVIGDNRSGQESLDSRNGLGQIPVKNVIGPVTMRIFPFDRVSTNF